MWPDGEMDCPNRDILVQCDFVKVKFPVVAKKFPSIPVSIEID